MYLVGHRDTPSIHRSETPLPITALFRSLEVRDGSTLELALAAGAALGPEGLDNALWFPSSVVARQDGSTAVWPHIVLDRAKPVLIAVDQAARRFVNEAVSYHEFVRAMYRAHADAPAIPAWLRSEEHTSELQSLMRRSYAVFCLEKQIHAGIDI